MRSYHIIAERLATDRAELTKSTEQAIDARLDTWNGHDTITVGIPPKMHVDDAEALAERYRKEGGFNVSIQPDADPRESGYNFQISAPDPNAHIQGI